MKTTIKTLITILLMAALVMLSIYVHAITIPLASPRQINASPLARGEVANIERTAAYPSDGGTYSELYIGGKDGPLRVIDGSALRGYKLRTLDPSEYSVSAGPLFTHDVANNTYTMTASGPTNSIIVTAKDGVAIEKVTVSREFTGEGLMPGELVCNVTSYNGSVYRWDVAFHQATSLVISKIEVVVRDIGEIDWVNDTEKVKFEIKDKLGKYDLFDLRYWVTHLYDWNRGEDWSRYKAVKPIQFNSQPLRFTEDNKFTLSISKSTNMVIQAAKRTAIEIATRTNAPMEYTTFAITEFDVGSANQGGSVEIDFITDVSGFDSANIGVEVSSALEEKFWLGLPETDFTVSNLSVSNGFHMGTVTIPGGIDGNARFFRLIYGGATSKTIDINLHGRVVIKDLLVIKGTDGKFYRIDINGGTITATEVSL